MGWNPDESARGRNQYGFLDVAVKKDEMTIVMINERGQITHQSTIKPLINTPKELEEVYKAEKLAAGKASAWMKADSNAKHLRELADKATQEREAADKFVEEKEAAEKEASTALDQAKKVSEDANEAKDDAEKAASEKEAAYQAAEAAEYD